MSENVKPTPGPWTATKSINPGIWHINSPCGDMGDIAIVWQRGPSETNAFLITAAPDMFEYAKRRAEDGDAEAIALVAKAEGRS